MKKLLVVSTLIASSLFSLPSFALVRVVASCVTANGQYQVNVLDNEGIGPVRTQNLGAIVRNRAGQTLAAYSVIEHRDPSISFGQFRYIDTKTGGKMFDLAFGSTNYRHITLQAVLNNGQRMTVVDPSCKSYSFPN